MTFDIQVQATGQAQDCGRIKPVNGIPDSPSRNWISDNNADINKQ